MNGADNSPGTSKPKRLLALPPGARVVPLPANVSAALFITTHGHNPDGRDLSRLCREATEASLRWAEKFEVGSTLLVGWDGDGFAEGEDELENGPVPGQMLLRIVVALAGAGYRPVVLECQHLGWIRTSRAIYASLGGKKINGIEIPGDLFGRSDDADGGVASNVLWVPYVLAREADDDNWADEGAISRDLVRRSREDLNLLGVARDVGLGAPDGCYGGMVGSELVGSTAGHDLFLRETGLDATQLYAWDENVGGGPMMSTSRVSSGIRRAIAGGVFNGGNVGEIFVTVPKKVCSPVDVDVRQLDQSPIGPAT